MLLQLVSGSFATKAQGALDVPFGMIQSNNVVLHLVNPPEIPHQDRGDRAQKDAVSRHEVQKAARSRQDLPGDHDPRNQGANQLAAPDVDIRRE